MWARQEGGEDVAERERRRKKERHLKRQGEGGSHHDATCQVGSTFFLREEAARRSMGPYLGRTTRNSATIFMVAEEGENTRLHEGGRQ